MKSSFNIVRLNAMRRGADEPTKRLGGAKRTSTFYNEKHERTQTGRVRVFHPSEVVPEYAMPIGHDARKALIMSRSYKVMRRDK